MPSTLYSRDVLSFQDCFFYLAAPCPHCNQSGNLCGHGFLYGFSLDGKSRVKRGRRVLCSNRGHKSGCGRTFSILLPTNLRRHIVSTRLFWIFLSFYLLGGRPLKTAWSEAMEVQNAIFSLSSGYKLFSRFQRMQSSIRIRLCQRIAPPSPSLSQVCSPCPLVETLLHLFSLFALSEDPPAEFQTCFQSGFLDPAG